MTATTPPQSLLPPAATSLEAHPWLYASVKSSISRQTARIQERVATFVDRRTTLHQINAVITALDDGGFITVEGAPGSGVTTLLAYLAATQPYAFWFYDDDAGQGADALYSQLVGLYHLSIPLIPPALHRPTALEHLLDEAAAQRSLRQTPADDRPMVVLIDPPTCPLQPREPYPPRLPAALPPGVLVIYGCTPDEELPIEPDARIALPQTGDELLYSQRMVLQAMACPDAWIDPICERAQGNFRAIQLAYRLCQGIGHATPVDLHTLPTGSTALHQHWWSLLDTQHQRLTLLLAAADGPVPLELCAHLLDDDPQPFADPCWITTDTYAATLELSHWHTRNYLAHHQADALRQMHTDIVALAIQQGIGNNNTENNTQRVTTEPYHYLLRHGSRHAALAPAATRDAWLPRVTERSWIRTQERYATLSDAAHDQAWHLHSTTATDSTTSLLRIVHSAALAGTLVSRALTMSPDDAVAALNAALEHMGREAALKRILALINQLPDGREKALVLRQLGEACFSLGARSSSMRLLSQALDIEDQKTPPSWREQREQLYMKLVEAALHLNDVDAALEMSARINHVERRGMAEKQVVYWLRERGNLARAQSVACAIQHENLQAWTEAEVAVTLARAGDLAAAEHLLERVHVETARAWAHIELACDIVAHDFSAACDQIDRLPTPNQRNHGLARLAEALGQYGQYTQAIDLANQISNMGVRLQTLVNLVELDIERSAAIRALEQATAGIGMLEHDVRVPLVAMLTASYTALGNTEKALRLAYYAAEGEERDRAVSRVAVAMVQHGQYEQGVATARNLDDDDERDWTLDEIIRILAESGRWEEAQQLTQEIRAEQQQAHTLADLAIAHARNADPMAAFTLATTIPIPYERARAFRMIAPHLVATGHATASVEIAHTHLPPSHLSRYLLALATALADQGNVEQSTTITRTIPHPLFQARAYLAIARAASASDGIQARAALVTALQSAILGRTEAFQLLEQAVPTLAALADASLLTDVAAAIEDIDTNW